MEDIITYKKAGQIDPTHTTALRNAFARDMNRRFLEITSAIIEGVINRDCFGLKKDVLTLQVLPPEFRQFAFLRDPVKVEAFMKWLQEQVDKGLLKVATFQQVGTAIEAAWTNMYVYDSYKRGVIRARYELQKAGFNIPPVDDITLFLNTPFHMDRIGLLFTRVYTELKNITSAMDLQISKILSQGLIDGDGPRLLARKLVSVINGDGVDRLGLTDTLGRFIPAQRRAEMLARTETIRSYAEATLNEFENWGIEEVYALAEFQTAGDERVCEKCAGLQGKIFTLKEAHGVIPVHTFCRCCWLPWIKELQKYY